VDVLEAAEAVDDAVVEAGDPSVKTKNKIVYDEVDSLARFRSRAGDSGRRC
jgi:hypothetical protein